MNHYHLSQEAEQDLEGILSYIRKNNIEAAYRWLIQLRKAMDRIATYPEIGHYRPDLTEKKIRFWPFGNYLIAYNNTEKPLKIVRIVSAYRNLETLFDEDKF